MSDAPAEVRALAERRAAARDARDFAAADDLRAQLAEAGWTVTDGPTGWRLEPSAPAAPAATPRAATSDPHCRTQWRSTRP